MTEKKPAHKPPAEKEKTAGQAASCSDLSSPDPAACLRQSSSRRVHTDMHDAGRAATNQYVTCLEPVFLDHLSRHQGQRIIVRTTVETLEGVLASVAVDHIQLNRHDKAFHIRTAQIVHFEGLPITYL